MTLEDQHTDLKSLRTVTGKSADWADLAQKALNHHQVFGSVLQMSQMRTKFEPNARQIFVNKPRQTPVH